MLTFLSLLKTETAWCECLRIPHTFPPTHTFKTENKIKSQSNTNEARVPPSPGMLQELRPPAPTEQTHWFPHTKAVPNLPNLWVYTRSLTHAPISSPTKQKVKGNSLELVFESYKQQGDYLSSAPSSSYKNNKLKKKVLIVSDVLQAAQTNEDKTITEHWPVWTGCCGHCCCGTRGVGGATFTAAQSKPVLLFLYLLHISHCLHAASFGSQFMYLILNHKQKIKYQKKTSVYIPVDIFFTVRVQKRRSEFRAVGWLLLECLLKFSLKKKRNIKWQYT